MSIFVLAAIEGEGCVVEEKGSIRWVYKASPKIYLPQYTSLTGRPSLMRESLAVPLPIFPLGGLRDGGSHPPEAMFKQQHIRPEKQKYIHTSY